MENASHDTCPEEEAGLLLRFLHIQACPSAQPSRSRTTDDTLVLPSRTSPGREGELPEEGKEPQPALRWLEESRLFRCVRARVYIWVWVCECVCTHVCVCREVGGWSGVGCVCMHGVEHCVRGVRICMWV